MEHRKNTGDVRSQKEAINAGETMFKTVLATVLVALLTGCMAMIFGTADQLDKVTIGMTREDVIKQIGYPKATSSDGDTQYMQYRWVKTVIATDANMPDDYYVALKGGKVISKGDFSTIILPTSQSQSQSTASNPDFYTKLKRIKELKDSGILTESEFNSEKAKILSAH